MVKKLIIVIFLIIIIVLIIGYQVLGSYFYNIALNPKTDKSFILEGIIDTRVEDENKNKRLAWLDENANEVYLTAQNNGNIKLHAYEIISKNNSDIWVITIHGYMSEANEMTYYAQEFNRRGYNVLMLDLRGHGKSEGNYIGMGWHDRLDVIDWIHYLVEGNNNSKIILYGISMGASTVMMTTGEELPQNVKLAISDCGFSSVWDEFSHQLKLLFNLPDFPILYSSNSTCKRKAHYSFKEASCVEQLKKSKTPTLFIHGTADRFVPYEMLDIVYESANCEKEKLSIEGAPHAMSSQVNNELYWKTIDEFIEKYLSNLKIKP